MPYAPRRIVITRDELHPAIRRGIDSVLGSRKTRAIVPVTTAAALIPINLFKVSNRAENLMLPAVAALAYKGMSADVRKHTENLGDTLRGLRELDNLGRFRTAEVRETHPYAFVNRKGDLILLPRSEMQAALTHAQRTFLKHILPGRYRIKI